MSPTVRVGEFSTLISNLVDQLTQRLAADDAPERLLVGLVGAPGSGKSTIAADLEGRLKEADLFAGLVAAGVPYGGALSTVLSFYIIALIDRQGVLHMVSDGNVEDVFLIFRQRIVRVS